MKIEQRINNPYLQKVNEEIDEKLRVNDNFLAYFLNEILEIADEIDNSWQIMNGNFTEKNQYLLFTAIFFKNNLDDLIFEMYPYLYTNWRSFYKNESFYSKTLRVNINNNKEPYLYQINKWLAIFAKLKVKPFSNLGEEKYISFFEMDWSSRKKFNLLLNDLNKYGYELLWNGYDEAILIEASPNVMLNVIKENSNHEPNLNDFYNNVLRFYKETDLTRKFEIFRSISQNVYNALKRKELINDNDEIIKLPELKWDLYLPNSKKDNCSNEYILEENKVNYLLSWINAFRHYPASDSDKEIDKIKSEMLKNLKEKNPDKFEIYINELLIEFLRIISILKINHIYIGF